MMKKTKRHERFTADEADPSLITDGPFAGFTLHFASTEGIEAECEAVDALLDLMDINSTFVSDLSRLCDFDKTQEELDAALPVHVDSGATLLEAIAAIRKELPGWPTVMN